MGKESALYQLMGICMNGVMNGITNSDGEYLLMPAHVRGIRQYLITIPVIHMDGGTRPFGLELGFIRLAKQDAQPPLVSFHSFLDNALLDF